MKMTLRALLGASAVLALTGVAMAQSTITVATVNNGDMIRMQGYTAEFTAKTGITVEWVTLEENVLRERVTTDITTKGWPVRHHDHRHVRNPDLGQERLAGPAE